MEHRIIDLEKEAMKRQIAGLESYINRQAEQLEAQINLRRLCERTIDCNDWSGFQTLKCEIFAELVKHKSGVEH